jgi:ribosomal-protein-serine acetyltransferase
VAQKDDEMTIKPILRDVPESFESERLTIRAPRFGDGVELYAAVDETLDSLRKWMEWAQMPQSVEVLEEYARRAHVAYLARDGFGLLLFLKGRETLVGGSGLHVRDWSVPMFEIGYWCRKRFEGRGYISEAVNAITRFGFESMNAERIVIRCDANNTRSAAVARRAGYTFEGVMRRDSRAADTNELRDTLQFAKIRAEQKV